MQRVFPAVCLVLVLLAGAARVIAEPSTPATANATTNTGAAGPAVARARPLIVIDPGHGGTNAGAPAAVPGLYEKQVTLALARLLWEELTLRGYRVVLTRDRDVYLTLRQRVRLANRLGADLFISLHTNATTSHSQRGYETFVLPPEALNVDARALRLEDGAVREGLDADTALLLDDLERGAAQEAAAALASAVQAQLRVVRGPEGDRGVRQGAMDVLMGATMPAVLVEVGFIDHPVEGRELADPTVRERIAAALANAVASVLPVPESGPDAGEPAASGLGSAHASPRR
jgi:N-acetylmuramoyl-L-alanine amidase